MKKVLLVSALFLLALVFFLHPGNVGAGCFPPNPNTGLCDSGAACPPGSGFGFCCDNISECGGVVNPGNQQFGCSWSGSSCVVGVSNCDPTTGYLPDPSFCAKFSSAASCNGKMGSCIAPGSPNANDPTCKNGTGINTAIGCIPITDPNLFIGFILRWAIGIGGGIAFLLIVYSAFMIMTSQGNPERLKAGQELLTSAIAGLIMLIFSVFILELIGVKILQIPGFSESPF